MSDIIQRGSMPSFSFSLAGISDNAGREIAAREAFPLAFVDRIRANPRLNIDFSRWHLIGPTFKNLIVESLSPFEAWLDCRIIDPVLPDDDDLFDADGHSVFTPDTQPVGPDDLQALDEPYLILAVRIPLSAPQAVWLKNNIRRLIHLNVFRHFASELGPLDVSMLADRHSLVQDEISTLFCTLEYRLRHASF